MRMGECKACGESKTLKARGWCSNCYSRWIAAGKPEGGPPSRRPAPQCGTRQGWDRHMYRKEKACDPCRRAHAAAVREWSNTSPALAKCRGAKRVAEWSDEEHRAARMVAAGAVDGDDCRLLLDKLGLLPSGAAAAGGAA
ncbi:hypothetical protein [Streptomyces longwoodensis]|uniref:hypothetical protein n=1 Tax=Streptomyces longwoodensis TaxID=68231 RepID=UPI00325006C0